MTSDERQAWYEAIAKHLAKLRDTLRGEIGEVRSGAAELRAEHAESRRRIAALEARLALIDGERQ